MADEGLRNTDFSKGSTYWKGDGKVVYLDGEGKETDDTTPGAIAVLKIPLRKKEAQSAYQEFETEEPAKKLKASVEIMASPDFKRTTDEELYNISWTKGSAYWSGVVVPHADFWIRVGPGWLYQLADASPAWRPIKATWNDAPNAKEWIVHFCVPPGEGAIYIKSPKIGP